MRRALFLSLLMLLGMGPLARAQMVMSGRVSTPRFAGSKDDALLSTVLAFAAPADPEIEPASFRTWETDPVGWYRLSGPASRYTLLFTQPAHYMRPFIATNVFAAAGEKLDRRYSPRFDFASFDDKDYDHHKASDYYQLFTARSTSITHVGFKLAHDGVDGAGPGSQTLLLSIHRRPTGDGAQTTPDRWPQVGPTMPVVEVDCGGPKNYAYSAGWNSGEVSVTPGAVYAIRLHPEAAGGTIQAFWREVAGAEPTCYRIGANEKGSDDKGAQARGYVNRELWMSVSGDGDGLVIPFNKRVHRAFGQLTKCENTWSQTYVAQGKSLASVICYAAVSGAQPPLARQRVMVRVRRDGPEGEVIGKPRVAIGNGNYTGDASWGVFGTTFAPGEIPLTPGATYAIEMQSIENLETLHGFTNIKGMVSDDRAGFNPYRKHARDSYERGTAFLAGKRQDFDLDMQITEYEASAEHWELALEDTNLVANGDMQQSEPAQADATTLAASKGPNRVAAWQSFAVSGEVVHQHLLDQKEKDNGIARVGAASKAKPQTDGGYVQRVKKRAHGETYRVTARARASWPNDADHQIRIGVDPTGQTNDPAAKTIVWTPVTKRHGTWCDFTGEPIRPATDAVSIWLRGSSKASDPWPYTADFDNVSLRQVRTSVPTQAKKS